MKKQPFVSKKVRKLSAKRCQVCGEDQYELLDVHRIAEGKSYSVANTTILCVACHRKHHTGLIKINGWFQSSMGKVLNWVDENGEEHFS